MFIYSDSCVNDSHAVSTHQQDSVNKPNYKFIRDVELTASVLQCCNPHTGTAEMVSSRKAGIWAQGGGVGVLGSSLGLQTGYPEGGRNLPTYPRHLP